MSGDQISIAESTYALMHDSSSRSVNINERGDHTLHDKLNDVEGCHRHIELLFRKVIDILIRCSSPNKLVGCLSPSHRRKVEGGQAAHKEHLRESLRRQDCLKFLPGTELVSQYDDMFAINPN